jgi:hypothetical protein
VRRFDPASDADVQRALQAAVEAGVAGWRIDRELVEAATTQPNDEFSAVIFAGRLSVLARDERRAAREAG